MPRRPEFTCAIGQSGIARGAAASSRAAALCMTIRGRILVAFLIMSVITAALGAYATMGIRNAGVLVDKTFDESLMSINYARAAASRFRRDARGIRAPMDRHRSATRAPRSTTRSTHSASRCRRHQDRSAALAIGSRRRGPPRACRARSTAWKSICERLLDGTRLDVNWETLDHYAGKVDDQIDLLVNYTAGDGFLYRQSARATVARDVQLNIAGTALALLLSALVAWAFGAPYRRPGRGRIERRRSVSPPASSTSRCPKAAPTSSARCSPPWA